MPEDELEPAAHGEMETVGEPDGGLHDLLERMKEDVERHGEVHATFEDTDKEVEVRLGTGVLDYEANLVRVFDGDQYRSFNATRLVSWEVPMDLFH